MNATQTASQANLPRITSGTKLKSLPNALADAATNAPWRPGLSGRLAVLIVLLALSFAMLGIAGGLSQIGEDKAIPVKIRTKVSKQINQFAFAICLLSAVEAVAACALLIKAQPGVCPTQSQEVSSAL